MIKLDLITGFLGSGKTTFIKMYARYLMENDKKLCTFVHSFFTYHLLHIIIFIIII